MFILYKILHLLLVRLFLLALVLGILHISLALFEARWCTDIAPPTVEIGWCQIDLTRRRIDQAGANGLCRFEVRWQILASIALNLPTRWHHLLITSITKVHLLSLYHLRLLLRLVFNGVATNILRFQVLADLDANKFVADKLIEIVLSDFWFLLVRLVFLDIFIILLVRLIKIEASKTIHTLLILIQLSRLSNNFLLLFLLRFVLIDKRIIFSYLLNNIIIVALANEAPTICLESHLA